MAYILRWVYSVNPVQESASKKKEPLCEFNESKGERFDESQRIGDIYTQLGVSHMFCHTSTLMFAT
jgi:hypothetical protein